MKTDITEAVGSSKVRVVVRATAWADMIGDQNYEEWLTSLHFGDPRLVRRALSVMLRDAGDLKPLQVDAEVDRLIEEEGVNPVAVLVQRAVKHALAKTEDVTKNSPAGAAASAVPGTTSSMQ